MEVLELWTTCRVDENRRASGMLSPVRDKEQGIYWGGDGAIPVTTACPEDGK